MKTFLESRKELLAGKITCEQLVQFFVQKNKEQAHLNAFLEVFDSEALQQAKAVDAKVKNGTAGKLAGLVIGLKDVIAYKGHKLQSSSNILNGYTSPYSSTVVERLLKEDAIIIGRQNCDEFAMGASNETSAFGTVLNALDNTKVSGGSSGGSAVAVQAELCHASLGSDTGGSVRQPAAFCGIVGLKPTYSRISRYGLIAYASSFDQIGVLAHNIADIAAIMEVITGKDDYDATVSQREVPKYSETYLSDKKYKIAYLKEGVEHSAMQPEIKAATLKTIESLKNMGHSVSSVEFPYLDFVVPTYYILTTAEASSNLSRYDGVRYGYRTAKEGTLEEMYKNTRSEGFGKEVQRRIMLGTFALSSSYYDAYYTKAQKVRRIIKEKTEDILKEYDFIVMPTTPSTAFKIGENTKDPIKMYLEDIFTVQASLAGLPAISVPVGKDNNQMPIGFQIIGKPFDETGIMNLSKQILAQ